MNAITTLILTLSVLMVLAVAGATSNVQNSSEASDTPPSKIAINHNETMLGSSLAIGQAYSMTDSVSDLLASIQAFFGRPTSGGGGCDDWECGSNHNETMLLDVASQTTDIWDEWLTSFEAFFSTKPTPGGCDDWGCGSNHNETMLTMLTMTTR